MREDYLPEDDNISTTAMPKTQDVFDLFHAKNLLQKRLSSWHTKLGWDASLQTQSELKKFKFSPSFQ